jgi:23S rRNA U2552 (ribose-2'-O)-methylase RlmE/FtsJ
MEFIKNTIKLPTFQSNILDSENVDKVVSSDSYINEPQMDLGYNTWTSIIKNRLDDQEYNEKLKSNQSYKYVNNPFEDKPKLKFNDFMDINQIVVKKLGIKEKISSRSFFKMWEMLVDYNLLDDNNDNFKSFHMAEAPGGFIQASINYNDKVNKTPTKSKFFGISLHNEIKFNPELQRQYGSGEDRRFYQFKTESKMNGDITDLSIVKIIKKAFVNDKLDLVTADGGFDPLDENYHEQESYVLILGEIFTALSIQKKGGNFVCKFFDMYTNVTIKLLSILSIFYEEIYLYKPFSSRQSNSERYVIAKNFKYSDSELEYKKYYDIVEKLLVSCKKEQVSNKNIIDIFTNFKIPLLFKSKLAEYNKKIGLNQYININTRLQYFKLFNLSGKEFENFSKIQEEATKFWISKYLENI